MLCKQLKSLGCPCPGDDKLKLNYQDAAVPPTEHHNIDYSTLAAQVQQQQFFRLWLYSSDNGSDQSSIKSTLLPGHIADSPSEGEVSIDCNMHQNQLIIKATLLIIDLHVAGMGRTWRYFASLAKIAHCWRDQARTVFNVWVARHGPQSAMEHAMRLPARPMSGRWGTVTSAEKSILAPTVQFVADVLLDVFQRKNNKRSNEKTVPGSETTEHAAMPRPVPGILKKLDIEEVKVGSVDSQNVQPLATATDANLNNETADLDEMRIESQKIYIANMSRWKREASAALCDPVFALAVFCAHTSRGPLDHFHSWIQRRVTETELWSIGNHIACLQHGKAAAISAEFDALFQHELHPAIAATTDAMLQRQLIAMMVHLMLASTLGFHWRVMLPLHRNNNFVARCC